jgi:hypothetical protein
VDRARLLGHVAFGIEVLAELAAARQAVQQLDAADFDDAVAGARI